MDADPWVAGVAESLRAEGAAERAAFEKRYLKSELEHYGVRVRAVRTVVKRALRSEPVRNRDELISLTEWRWRSPVHEMRLAATELPVARVGLLAPGMRGSWSV